MYYLASEGQKKSVDCCFAWEIAWSLSSLNRICAAVPFGMPSLFVVWFGDGMNCHCLPLPTIFTVSGPESATSLIEIIWQ